MSFQTGYEHAGDCTLDFLRDIHRAESLDAAQDMVRAEIGGDDNALAAVLYVAACINWQRIDAVALLAEAVE